MTGGGLQKKKSRESGIFQENSREIPADST